MRAKRRNSKESEKKIEGMRKFKAAYEAAKKAGKIVSYKIQPV